MDAVETINGGILIQILGELSTNSLPLRRFAQTVVLTLESTNKYYVKNDIFRFLDDGYGFSNVNLPVIQQCRSVQTGDSCYIEPVSIEERNEVEVNESESKSTAPENEPSQESADQKDEIQKVSKPSVENEVEDCIEDDLDNSIDVDALKDLNLSNESSADEKSQKEHVAIQDDVDLKNGTTVNCDDSDEPKTWAKMVTISKKVMAMHSGYSPPSADSPAGEVLPPESLDSVNGQKRDKPKKPDNPGRRVESGRDNKSKVATENIDVNDSASIAALIASFSSNSSEAKKYSDEHQLFVGNLLANFNEIDLIRAFQKYGSIIDVRINRQMSRPGARPGTRNFGFITFDDPETVNQIIAQKVRFSALFYLDY